MISPSIKKIHKLLWIVSIHWFCTKLHNCIRNFTNSELRLAKWESLFQTYDGFTTYRQFWHNREWLRSRYPLGDYKPYHQTNKRLTVTRMYSPCNPLFLFLLPSLSIYISVNCMRTFAHARMCGLWEVMCVLNDYCWCFCLCRVFMWLYLLDSANISLIYTMK